VTKFLDHFSNVFKGCCVISFLSKLTGIGKALRKVGIFTLSAKVNTSAVDLHIKQAGVFKDGFVLVDCSGEEVFHAKVQ